MLDMRFLLCWQKQCEIWTAQDWSAEHCSFFKGLDNEDNAAFGRLSAKRCLQGGSVINMDNSYGKKIWMEYTAPFVKDWDVVGYNYLNYHYETIHELFPDRVILLYREQAGAI